MPSRRAAWLILPCDCCRAAHAVAVSRFDTSQYGEQINTAGGDISHNAGRGQARFCSDADRCRDNIGFLLGFELFAADALSGITHQQADDDIAQLAHIAGEIVSLPAQQRVGW